MEYIEIKNKEITENNKTLQVNYTNKNFKHLN